MYTLRDSYLNREFPLNPQNSRKIILGLYGSELEPTFVITSTRAFCHFDLFSWERMKSFRGAMVDFLDKKTQEFCASICTPMYVIEISGQWIAFGLNGESRHIEFKQTNLSTQVTMTISLNETSLQRLFHLMPLIDHYQAFLGKNASDATLLQKSLSAITYEECNNITSGGFDGGLAYLEFSLLYKNLGE